MLFRSVPRDLETICLKCLQKDPGRRYRSAQDLSDELGRFIRGDPILARPPSVAERAWRWCARKRALSASLGTAAFLLVAGVVVSTWQAVRAKAEAAKSQQVARFLQDMLKGVGPSVALGRDTKMLREILDQTAERVGRELNNQPEIRAGLQAIIGNVYRDLGLYDKAEAMHRKVLATVTHLRGSAHPDVASALCNLGAVLQNEGKLPEAENLDRQALAMRKKLFGSEHPDVAISLENLAQVLGLQGKLKEAEATLREVVAMQKRLPGNEHPDVATSIQNLAQTLRVEGDLVQAETMEREALAMRRKLLGDNHPNVAVSLNGLAVVLVQQGRLHEAEILHREALALRKKLLGSQHPGVSESLNNLAILLHNQGNFAEAETMHREAIGSVTHSANQQVSIIYIPPPPSFTSLSINGPSSVNENSTAQFSASAWFSDGSSQVVVPTWTVDSVATSISIFGLLSAGEVTSDTSVTISASYTTGGMTRSAQTNVTVINTPTYTISGHVRTPGGSGISGVTVSGLPGNPSSDASGYYSATVTSGWSGAATPGAAGYTFSPPSRTYSNLSGNQTGQDYTGTPAPYTISGNVRTSGGAGISGVTMSGLPGNPSTDANGFYSATVPSGWSGTVTPAAAGYTFSPASRSYSNVAGNQPGQDYAGTPVTYTISGNVRISGGAGISGVTLSGLPGNPSTDANGYYSATVTSGWSGTATPGAAGYTFSPPSRSYSNLPGNQTGQDYTGTPAPYSISGNVRTSGGAGISGVTMSGLPGNPTTDANGYYSATVPSGWSGTATPGAAGYTFSPPSRSYSNLAGNKTGQDYTGTPITYTISGNVRTSAGAGISAVTMSGLPGNSTTDANGYYSATVPSGWSGTVAPGAAGYTFSPSSKSYSNVTSNLTGQHYTGQAGVGSGTAAFVGTDAATQGSWRRSMGGMGLWWWMMRRTIRVTPRSGHRDTSTMCGCGNRMTCAVCRRSRLWASDWQRAGIGRAVLR